jgi:ACS family hexuronate transporter-like MFS transporter
MVKNFIVLLCAQIFVCFGGLTIPPLIPFIQPELKLNYTQVGSIMTFLYFGAMVMSLPAGWLTDRLGVKKTIVLSQVFMGLFVALFSLIGNYFMAILLAFAMGLGYGMVNPPTTKGIMVLVKRENRGFAMSVKQTGVPIGSAIAAGLLPPLALRFSWEFSLIFAGIIVILSGLLSHILYQQSREGALSFDFNPKEASQVSWKKTYQNKNIIFLGIGGAFCSLVQIALVTYIILYLKDAKKFDLILAAFCLVLVSIGGILGRIFWGVVSDWLFKGSRKVVLKLIVSLIFLVSLILGLNVHLSLIPLFFVLFIFGFSAIGWNGVYHAFVGELSEKEMAGRAIGLIMTITFIGNLSGPILFGKIIDVTGSYSMAWYFLCASMVGAFILFSMIQESKISPFEEPLSKGT